MKSTLLFAALLAATTGAVIAYPALQPAVPPIDRSPPLTPPPASNGKPLVEAVFVLDTTGSMSGLIEAAKQNIWSIATSMAQAQPTPEIRIGLVAFRDRGDAYVTRIVDLSSDLDSMYAQLMDLQAGGGGDTPESVNQALHEAVHALSWSRGSHAYRTIFLVGDAPPHTDYQDDVPFAQTLKDAQQRGIVVNTLQAGSDADTTRVWQQIAALNQGRFLQVGQAGDAVAVATPFDAEIAELSREMDATRLYYGDADTRQALAEKQAATDKLHSAASVESRAKRAVFNASPAGHANAVGENDLVDAVVAGRVDLGALGKDELPASLQALDGEAQARVVAETAARRAELKERLDRLAGQRSAHVAEQLAKRDDTAKSLDYQLFEAVKAQAETKGLHYADAPAN